MKDSDLIFGLMAAIGKSEYSMQDLKHLTAPFGVTESSLRTNLSRMATGKTIERNKKDKTVYYRFGRKGKSISENVSRSFDVLNWDDWDRSFWGVIFSVPVNNKRHYIRTKLKKYRFASMYPGFWIRPINKKENIPESLQSIISAQYCSLIRFYNQNELGKSQVEEMWNLGSVNNGFKKGINIIENSLRKLENINAEQALVERMITGDSIVNMLFKDPMLPEKYLPQDWSAEHLRSLFKEFDKKAADISMPYWKQIF